MRRILGLIAFSASAVFAQNVTAVLDGGAYTSNVAQGSVFVVKGTNLSGAGFVQATAPSYPTTLNSVRITLTPTSPGTVVNALMVYTYNLNGVNQLAAVLPSNTATGAYDLRVINGTQTSVGFRTTVQARKPGIVTAAGDGSGPAQATLSGGLILQRTSNLGKIGDFDSRPARPGERVDFWGTGLGPDAASDTGGTSGDLTSAASIRVLVDSIEVTPVYAGRSQGFPGLDQIVINLPGGVTPSCTVNIQIRAGGVLSNSVTIAVSATDTCTTPGGGGGGGGGGGSLNPTQSEIDSWIARGSYVSGGVSFNRSTSYITTDSVGATGITPSTALTKSDSIGGQFTRISGADFGKSLRGEFPPGFPNFNPGVGSCTVYTMQQILQNPFPAITALNLDAGDPLRSVGPNGSQNIPRVNNQVAGPTYATPSSLPNTYINPGSYTVSGPGGSQVGAFSGSFSVVSDFVISQPETSFRVVNRSSPLNISWTGGAPGTVLTIQGQSTTITGTTIGGAGFICIVNTSAGGFTVPASVLSQLPASPSIGAGGFNFITRGSLSILAPGAGARINAPSGVDIMTLNNFWSWSYTPEYR